MILFLLCLFLWLSLLAMLKDTGFSFYLPFLKKLLKLVAFIEIH